jgi:hypothetical protein
MNPDGGPRILKIPIGINAAGTRRETDSMGEGEVPADRYWGAQTARSLIHFSIGNDHMPKQVYHAYGYVKKAPLDSRPDLPRVRRSDRRRPRRALPATYVASWAMAEALSYPMNGDSALDKTRKEGITWAR